MAEGHEEGVGEAEGGADLLGGFGVAANGSAEVGAFHVAFRFTDVDVTRPAHGLARVVVDGCGVVGGLLGEESAGCIDCVRIDHPGVLEEFVVVLQGFAESVGPVGEVEDGEDVARDIAGGLAEVVDVGAEGEALGLGEVVVEAAGVFVVAIFDGGGGVVHLAIEILLASGGIAGTGGGRSMSGKAVVGDLHCDGIERGGSSYELVWLAIGELEGTKEPAAGLCLRPCVACSAGGIFGFGVIDEAAEITGQLLLSGSGGFVGGAGADGARSLIVKKSEELVLDDGSSDIAAELMAFQRIQLTCVPVFGVQVLVAPEFEETAVNVVGAAARDHADHSAGSEAIDGAEVVGDETELLDGVRIGRGGVGGLVVVHVGDAVEHVVDAALATSICRRGVFTWEREAILIDEAQLAAIDDARCEESECGRIAAVQRELRDRMFIDGGAEFARSCVDELGIALNDDDLALGRADFETDILRRLHIGVDNDARLGVVCEAR